MHGKKMIWLLAGAAAGYYLSQPDTFSGLDPILMPIPQALGTSGTATQLVFAAEGAGLALLLRRFL